MIGSAGECFGLLVIVPTQRIGEFVIMLYRCDLDIKSEMEVVDAGLVWIWKQKNRLAASQLVFSRIRSAFLSPGDRSTIRQRVKALWEGEKVRIAQIFCSYA